jgi:hypothetical protein
MRIAITLVWVNWVGETERFPVREMAGVLVKDRPGLKVHWNLTACAGKVAEVVTDLLENIPPVDLEKLMDPHPSPTCMVDQVVERVITWVLVQEEVRSPLKLMVMET